MHSVMARSITFCLCFFSTSFRSPELTLLFSLCFFAPFYVTALGTSFHEPFFFLSLLQFPGPWPFS